MRLLRMISTLDPAYGGPVEALRQSVLSLEEMGHSNEVVTLDDPSSPWLTGFPSMVHPLGPSFGKYSFSPKLLAWLVSKKNNYDAVIVEGIWQYQSLAAYLNLQKTNMPYFVFVHGALDPWFREKFPLKHIKKLIYWSIVERHVLRNAVSVLYTSLEENELAAKSFNLNKINSTIVNLGIRAEEGDYEMQRKAFLNEFPVLAQKRYFLFLGRLHPKKGCDLLIKAFCDVVKNYPEMFLVMAGPDSDGYQSTLKRLVIEFGLQKQVIWTGLLTNDVKWGALRSAELFVLPSHSENFGMAVVEALACGLPVLITPKVNIWREIEKSDAGLISNDNEKDVIVSLVEWLKLSEEEKKVYRRKAFECFMGNFEIAQTSRRLVDNIERQLIEIKK